MKNRTIYIIVSLGILVIALTFSILYIWMKKALDQQEMKFSQSVQNALLEVVKKVSGTRDYGLPNVNPVIKEAPDYYVVDLRVTVEKEILEFYLVHELEKAGVKTDFEYGIFDCSSEQMVYGNFVSCKDICAKNHIPTIFKKQNGLVYYFVVKFPDYTRYTISSIRFLTGVSVLSLLFLLFMAYAVFIILYQMRFSQLQKDFINNMTHEFKTPISSIAIAADNICHDDNIKKDSKIIRYAEIIKDQNQRLNNLVEKVLRLAVAEKQSFKLAKKQIELNDTLKSIAMDVQTKLVNGGSIRFISDFSEKIIEADEIHFLNVIYTLIDNSVKYSNQSPEITIKTENHSINKTIISVEDKGIGMEKKYHKKIFQKFYRIPTGDVHNVKGYGLGLFYVHKICKKHGWKIRMESEAGKGTTIKIFIK